MTAAIVIPARFASERFPGKPLAPIDGVPMIVRVWRNMTASALADRVVVATDDDRIADAILAAGGVAIMTSPSLPSGSDRVWAACEQLNDDIVVNVQGDEPLMPATLVDALIGHLQRNVHLDIATAAVEVPAGNASSPDEVTVAVGAAGEALYFSRSTIPYGAAAVRRHLGVYAYRREALRTFVSSPPTPLELTERLEQLRALELGLKIGVVTAAVPIQAVDRPRDVARVEQILAGGAPQTAVRAVVFDVDGVLTRGEISYLGTGEQLLTFNVKDGQGIKLLQQHGFKIGIISSRNSGALQKRCEELGIVHVAAGVHEKASELHLMSTAMGIPLAEICYVGDDLPDLPAIELAGMSAAPADAAGAVKSRVDLVLASPGGRGAARELADRLLAAQC